MRDGNMIDKIIDIYEKQNKEEINSLKDEVIKSHNARYMFIFAYYFPEYIDDEFNKNLIGTNDKRYITFMFRQIKNINEKVYFNKILKYDNIHKKYRIILKNMYINAIIYNINRTKE